MNTHRLQTIVESDNFVRQAAKLLAEGEYDDLKTFLAHHPEAGVVMRGTGGVRKLRWGRQGGGKSGGVRVIYYFHSPLYPLLLMDMYAKADKENLSKAERNALAKYVERYIDSYRSKP